MTSYHSAALSTRQSRTTECSPRQDAGNGCRSQATSLPQHPSPPPLLSPLSAQDSISILKTEEVKSLWGFLGGDEAAGAVRGGVVILWKVGSGWCGTEVFGVSDCIVDIWPELSMGGRGRDGDTGLPSQKDTSKCLTHLILMVSAAGSPPPR